MKRYRVSLVLLAIAVLFAGRDGIPYWSGFLDATAELVSMLWHGAVQVMDRVGAAFGALFDVIGPTVVAFSVLWFSFYGIRAMVRNRPPENAVFAGLGACALALLYLGFGEHEDGGYTLIEVLTILWCVLLFPMVLASYVTGIELERSEGDEASEEGR